MKFLNDTISIMWSMTTVCNYKCSYCPTNLHDGKYKFPTDAQNIINFLNDVQDKNKNKKIYLTILGGEPILWPKFNMFLKKLNNNVYVEVMTNGSRPLQWWIDNINTLDRIYSLILTFHPENANKDEFIKVVSFLAKNFKNYVYVNIMVPPNDKYSINMYKKLEKIDGLTVRAKAIRENFGDNYLNEYTNEELEIIKSCYSYNIKKEKNLFYFDNSTFYKLSFEKKNTWKNYLCHIGLDSFYIYHDETIYRGTCRVGGNIGTLDNYILPLTGVICNKDFCPCVSDAIIKKEKINVK